MCPCGRPATGLEAAGAGCNPIGDKACREMGIENPRIAVAGLNPHSGEHGLFGQEEIQEIILAIEAARAEGIQAEGPVPRIPCSPKPEAAGMTSWWPCIMTRDTSPKVVGFVYDQEKQAWDAVAGVNITLGLPIIRVSVDHGTAFDQAGTGTASELSLKNSLEYAVMFARNRKQKSV